jgi:hypothetical protein
LPTITLTDASSASLDATVLDDSVFGKTPGSVIHFLRSDVVGALDQTLDQVQINSLSIGFAYSPSFSLSGGTGTFTAGGGPTGELDLYKPAAGGGSSPLFATDQFGTDIEMNGNYYLALSLQLGIAGGGNATMGAFLLTPAISATGSAKLYLPFGRNDNGAYPTLKSAIESLLEAFDLPSSADDLGNLPQGAVFAYDTQGSVGFQAQLNFLAVINPTATPGVSTSFGPINVSAGPNVTIGGGFTLAGEIETRIWKKSANVVQIGYYKKRGSSFGVTFDASLAADVTVGDYDIVAKIYGLLGDSEQLDPAWLKAHVPASMADDVEKAYESAVQTKLSIALDEECDTTLTDQAAFSWNFDLSKLDEAGKTALANVFKGNLTALMGSGAPPAGVTRAGSILDRTTEAKHTFSLNFLGLYDYATVHDATLNMSATVSEDGQLIMTDTAHLRRLAASATPFVKGDQLRHVLAEDCVATIGYAVSFGRFITTLKVGYSYFDYKSKARPDDLRLFVYTALQLGAANAAMDWAGILHANSNSQAASLFASLNYAGEAGRRLFLDQDGNARSIPDYQEVGRIALKNTPGLGLDPQFVSNLNDAVKWQQLLNAGTSQNFDRILGVDQINPPAWVQPSFTWTLHVAYWASAMHSAAQALQDVLQYLAQNPGIYPLHDDGFLNRRRTFASQLKNAIQKAPLFDDALGLMTIFDTAPPLSRTVTITYAGTTKTYA